MAADPAEIVTQLRDAFLGARNTTYLAVVSATLLVYDHLQTLDQEFKYFWGDKPWTISRALFLLNRYSPYPPLAIVLVLTNIPHPESSTCLLWTRVGTVFHAFSMTIVVSTMVLRVWYLYARSPLVRGFTILFTLACICVVFWRVDAVFFRNLQALDLNDILRQPGCHIPAPDGVWSVFAPVLILHAYLYIATVAHALRPKHWGAEASFIVRRLVFDGGLFFCVVFISIGFASVGAIDTAYYPLSTPAVFSNFMLVATSVSVSRVLLSIRSLAKRADADAEFLLNDLELARTAWKRGARDGEILVEVDCAEDDDEASFYPFPYPPADLSSLGVGPGLGVGSRTLELPTLRRVTTTRAGVLDADSVPQFHQFGPRRRLSSGWWKEQHWPVYAAKS